MSGGGRTIRFSVSLPEDLLRELDDRVIGRGYASRSEFVRDRIRDLLVEERWAGDDAEVHGVVTILYDHHRKDLVARIMDVQHERHVNVLCTTHVHLDHRHCLETIILRGTPREIEDTAVEIGGLRGVQFHGVTRAIALDGPAGPRRKRRTGPA